MTVFDAIAIRDVVADDGSVHVEPPLDVKWSPQEKLIWLASLIEHRTGITCRVNNNSKQMTGAKESFDHYGIQVGDSSTGADYASAWAYLSGVEAGARAVAEAAVAQS
jgi:hypothetical protein